MNLKFYFICNKKRFNSIKFINLFLGECLLFDLTIHKIPIKIYSLKEKLTNSNKNFNNNGAS